MTRSRLSIGEVAANLAPYRPHVETSVAVPPSAAERPAGAPLQLASVGPDFNNTPTSAVLQARLANELHTYLCHHVGLNRASVLYHRALRYVEEQIELELGHQARTEQDI